VKIIKSIAIIAVLIGLPAGSWYFLKDGFDWRKAKLEELAPKGTFFDAFNFNNEDKEKLFREITYKTTLVKVNEDLSKDDIDLIDQFKQSYTFLFLVMTEDPKAREDYSSKQPLRYLIPSTMTPSDTRYKDASYMLLDTSMTIRQFYTGTDHETLTQIVEDIAVVLPRHVTPDIEMKKPKQDQ